MEDFLWLSQQLQYGTKLLKEGQSYALPSPPGVKLEITGANIDENGNYVLVITCSTNIPQPPFGISLLAQTEEQWAREHLNRTPYADPRVTKGYKGIVVYMKFITSKGTIEDTFLKPPYATVKRTITLPAPYSYLEVAAYLSFDVDEKALQEYTQTAQSQMITVTIALIGTLTVAYNEELAKLVADLGKLNPNTLDYWFKVSQIAETLKKMGYIEMAAPIAEKAGQMISQLTTTAQAKPITATPPQATTAETTAPEETEKEEEETYTPQPQPPSPEELKKKYIPV